MRVLYLLFLVPLGAFASCPAGLHLQNVSIGTALPYCVKWESSTLGGCEVACPDVCVETPATGTMGPIYSSGVECSVGGDGDGDGDTGGSPGGDGSLPGDTGNIAGWQYFNHYGYQTVGYTLSKINTNLGKQYAGVNSMLSGLKDYSNQIADSTFKTQLELSGVNDRLNEALPYIKEASGRIEGTNLYLSRIEPQLEIANVHLKKLADAADSTGSGDGGLSKPYWDSKLGEMFGRMDRDYFGGIQNIDRSTSNSAQNLAAITSQLGTNGVNGHLMDIKNILESGSSGGSGTGQGNDIDYSKMPGSSNSPLEVAKSEYQSTCQGTNCYFDIAAVEKEYKDKQAELTDKYKEIKEDATKVFDYSLSGTAEVPKCFELYSFNGQTYSICPDASGYWETLAALLLFMFYIVALMIIFRR